MKRFIDKKGNIFTVDKGDNLFKNGKLQNPNVKDKFDGHISVKENTKRFISQDGVETLLLVKGHVPKFEYGYGENKVNIDTGQKAW